MSMRHNADARLRSFIDRIEQSDDDRRRMGPLYRPLVDRPQPSGWVMGPKRPRVRQGVSIEDASLMLEVCARLCRVGGADDSEFPEDRRGLTIACKLTGLAWSEIQKAIADCAGGRFEDAAVLWARSMCPPDARYLGVVYTAFNPEYRDFIKVGFSTNPAKRMKELSRQHGARIVLGSVHPGTMLHEWALHQTLGRAVATEWYRASNIPSWLRNPVEHAEAA